MKTSKKIEISSILVSILLFILGLVLFIDFNGVINFISYVLGTIIIGLGVYKLWSYYSKKLNNMALSYDEFGFGLVDVVLGILIIVLSDAFITISRFFLGGFILLAGINRFIQAISSSYTKGKFWSLLIMSIIVMTLGVVIILDKDIFNIIGLLIMIYSVIEIIECIMFRDTTKESIITEVIEAEIVEEKEEPKEDKKTNNKKSTKKTTSKKKKDTKGE